MNGLEVARERAQGKHRIVVVGSGFAGLFFAKAMDRPDVDITLIARTTHHLFQPLLYQVATGILSEGEIAPSTREVMAKQQNTTVLLGNVSHIDVQNRTVTSEVLGFVQDTPYDTLILGAGAGQSYFGMDHFAENAPGLKTIDDALELRGRIFGAFELAELSLTEEEVKRALTFVVVGAGATGVEVAGQIAELSQRTLRHDFRRIDPTVARVLLLDATDKVLGPFGENLSSKVALKLSKLGVEIQLGAKVVDIDPTGLVVEHMDGTRRRIESLTKVWAAGVRASSLGQTLHEQTGVALDRAGRVEVEPDLTVPGHPEIFVLGDMLALKNYPGVAQVAIQSARHAAKTVRARLDNRPEPGEFFYKDKGSMATVSRFSAVAKMGKTELSGFPAWMAWLAVHIVYIIGFKNQFTTLLHWFVTFVGRGRSQRTLTVQQVLARNALAKERMRAEAEMEAEIVRDHSPEATEAADRPAS